MFGATKGGGEGRSSMLSCVKGRDKAPNRPMEKKSCIALSLQQAKGMKGTYARAMRRCRRAAEAREVGAWSTLLLHARLTQTMCRGEEMRHNKQGKDTLRHNNNNNNKNTNKRTHTTLAGSKTHPRRSQILPHPNFEKSEGLSIHKKQDTEPQNKNTRTPALSAAPFLSDWPLDVDRSLTLWS